MGRESPDRPTTPSGPIRTVNSMPSDIDGLDLYPPDADDLDVTDDERQSRMRAVVGSTLLVWGTSMLVQIALGIDIDTFALGLGVGALAGWTQVRRYTWFVVGSILTGLGAAEVSEAVTNGAFGASVRSLLIAAGFAAIYVRYPRRSKWALVPAGIMALLAAAAFGAGLIGLLPALLGRFLLPLLLVSGGALLLFRNSFSPKTVKVGLAALATAFVLVGVTSVPDGDRVDLEERAVEISPPLPVEDAIPLPSLDGRTLVLDGTTGSVEFRTSGTARIEEVGARPFRSPLVVDEDGDDVRVGFTDVGPGRQDEPDVVVFLPEGVEVDVRRESGDITGTLSGARGSIRTESGSIDLELEDGGREGRADDGPYEFDTDSGSITLDSDLVADLDLETDSGAVEVNEVSYDERYRSDDELRGVGIEVDADSDSGDIRVDLPSPSAPPTPTAPPLAPVPPDGPTPPSPPT